jgi:hypothetical protein
MRYMQIKREKEEREKIRERKWTIVSSPRITKRGNNQYEYECRGTVKIKAPWDNILCQRGEKFDLLSFLGESSTTEKVEYTGDFFWLPKNDRIKPSSKRVTITCPDGSKYTGCLDKNYRMNGQVNFTSPSGFFYIGKFEEGKPKGNATVKMKLKDGSVCEGSCENGKMQGKCKIKYPDGRVSEGNFIDGKLGGNGIITHLNGHVFEGNFVNGKLRGKGKVRHPDGRVSEGNFVNGKLRGKGKVRHPDGRVSEGNFVNGKLEKKGKMISPEGYAVEVFFLREKLTIFSNLKYRYFVFKSRMERLFNNLIMQKFQHLMLKSVKKEANNRLRPTGHFGPSYT